MTFKKPYRICNTARLPFPEPMRGSSRCITATLKEHKDKYELRIDIPAFRNCDFDVYIKDGILYVCENNPPDACKPALSGYFPIPAHVEQSGIKTYYRSYGLMIEMPLRQPDGKVLHIPIQQDRR